MAEKYDFMENFDKNNERFKAEISKYIDDNKRTEGYIVLGETPPVLSLADADESIPLIIDNSSVDHIIDFHINTLKEREKITKEDIINMYVFLINPVCIISGDKKNTIMVILDIKTQNFGDNLAIPIEINKQANANKVNFIDTEYPRRETFLYIAKEIMKHNLIAANNKKLENLLRPIGLLLPVEHTSYSSYDESIAHNTDNVKYEQGERLFKFNTDNKYFKPKFKASFEELNKATNELGWGHATQYFIFGEELSSVRKNEFLWDFKMLKYDTDRHQLENRLIENKTKEIEEKLKEIKSMLNVKEEIKNSAQKFLNETSFTFEDKYGIAPDQKMVGYYEETDKEDLVYRICNEMQIDVLDEEGMLKKYYSDIPNVTIENVYDTFYKDCHIIVDEMYRQSKENLAKIREDIKEQLKETINDFNGKTFDEKMLNFYNYYKDIYEKQHDLSEDKGVGYNFAKDGNGACLIYYEEFRKFYNYEKEKSSLDFKTYEEFRNYKDNIVPVEDEKLYNTYLKDVNDVCNKMYNEALNKTMMNEKPNKFAEATAEIMNSDIEDTLEADCAKIVEEMTQKEATELENSTENANTNETAENEDEGNEMD